MILHDGSPSSPWVSLEGHFEEIFGVAIISFTSVEGSSISRVACRKGFGPSPCHQVIIPDDRVERSPGETPYEACISSWGCLEYSLNPWGLSIGCFCLGQLIRDPPRTVDLDVRGAAVWSSVELTCKAPGDAPLQLSSPGPRCMWI
ncbi:hypothetical protein Nepgr_027204 [Nepenthes gracilis]|uniref:Uncharacterized protein n=1 Tax=Nepenthes gracilis TaxID=150966 RepID=A0AAD3TA34_NEPGR|nr:hypothetical protein Nepgr_027204 [Nepenthes gracilis]